MAKIKKKGQAGQAKNYITRTQAVRKLQITLPDFRRLCIFKGIYPREPRRFKTANKSATHSTTFYYTKDIQYLLHEPLLAKFREQKALSKKIARSLGRNEIHDAARLEKNGMPKIKLDHIIRERYPTFADAIRDLDDALSLLFLFANLPASPDVPAKIIARCQRLCHEFEHYLITTKSLKKSFLSIKGIYYQATIQGQDVMWLVPYRFVQRVTQEVDYRIMGTFVDLYCTLLGFVNYKLYTSVGLIYPPRFDATSDEKSAELAAFTLEGRKVGQQLEEHQALKVHTNGYAESENSLEVQKALEKVAEGNVDEVEVQEQIPAEGKAEEDDNIDNFEVAAPEGDILDQPDMSSNNAAELFSNFTFFISREAPRHPIEFLLRAFGCKRIGWNSILGEGAFTHDETDDRITHQVVDRPVPQNQKQPLVSAADSNTDYDSQNVRVGHIVPDRIYVQPQWIWDCVNEGRLLRTDFYGPGSTLPPHLSPWMKPTKGQYDPTASLAQQEVEGEAELEDSAGEDQEDNDIWGNEDNELANAHAQENDMDVANSEEDGGDDLKERIQNKAGVLVGIENEENASEDEPDSQSQHQKELEAEAAGLPFSTARDAKDKSKDQVKKKRALQQRKEDQELERQKMMMSRKKRKLFEKMQYSNKKKDQEAEKLRSKRRKIEKVRT